MAGASATPRASRVAALYDIHGNWPALRAVLADLEREAPDMIVIGGDVLPGPMPGRTLQALRALSTRSLFVLGNGDREVVAAYDVRAAGGQPEATGPAEATAAWSAAQLDAQARHFLASFEPVVRVDIQGLGPTLFCHGSPRSDTEALTTVTSERRRREALAATAEATVVCGHTHRQFDRRVGSRRLLNAGSVGMPYEGDAAAFWLMLGPDASMRRTEYDVPAAVVALRDTGFPHADEWMLHDSLIAPADPDAVAEHFERTLGGPTAPGP